VNQPAVRKDRGLFLFHFIPLVLSSMAQDKHVLRYRSRCKFPLINFIARNYFFPELLRRGKALNLAFAASLVIYQGSIFTRKFFMMNVTTTRRSLRLLSCACFATLVLSACGGGGGSSGGAGTSGTSGTSASQIAAASLSSSTDGPFGQDANNYSLTFADEFNGDLNTSVWNDKIWYENSNPTKNYAVEDGKLKIWPERDASGNFFNRTIDTDGKYYQTYGYFEVEAKLGVGKGTWPAFWLFNHIDNRRPEIDVMEAYAGGGPGSGWSDANFHPTAYASTIWSDGGVLAGTKTMQTTDLSAGFHKYAVKWEPNKLTFYFDGQEVYVNNITMGDKMYMMLDLWFGSASGAGDASTPTGKGNSYEVNYIRAWQFK
jgi:beta-glucanase (GH16 family)